MTRYAAAQAAAASATSRAAGRRSAYDFAKARTQDDCEGRNQQRVGLRDNDWTEPGFGPLAESGASER